MAVGTSSDPEARPAPAPKATVARLALYLRELDRLVRDQRETVSSQQLARALQLSAAQVRKDLALFGQFGSRGRGYQVHELRAALREVIGTNRCWHAALIGVGNLGRALLRYKGFVQRGFEIVALFDDAPDLLGKRFGDLAVLPMAELYATVAERHIDLAILAVPAEAAEGVARQVVEAGITGILSFSPTPLVVPKTVSVVSVDLALHLEQLAFQVNQSRT